MSETLVSTQLYSKEGNETTPLAPKTLAEAVVMNDADGIASTVAAEIIKVRLTLSTIQADGVHFKGPVSSANPLPPVAYKAGWFYVVQEAGTYAGMVCEVGDFIYCIKTYASGSASDADWTSVQKNLVGAVTGPDSSVVGNVPMFSGTAGDRIVDSGFSVKKSVPADAKFTDTTYNPATDVADGLLTGSLHKKLVGIEENAQKVTTARVKAAGAFMPADDNADSIADGTTKKLMTADERTKLEGIATGAEVNQNAVAKVKVGTVTITASVKQDTVNIVAGEGIDLTGDAAKKSVTITEKYRDTCVVSSLDAVPENLRNGGLIILKA